MVTSDVVESKPLTDSLKVTEQLKLVLFVGVVLGVQVKAVTLGAWRSTTTEAGDPATAVWALPARSETEKVEALVRLLVPVAPETIEDVAGIVQVGVPVPVIGPIELMLVNVKSVPATVEIVEQSRFSLPVRVNVRLVELVGLAVTAARVRVGATVSIVYDKVEDAVEPLPALSDAAPAAIWIVSVPSVLGAPRLTVNV